MGQFTGARFQGARARARASRPLLIASVGLALPLAFVAAGARAGDSGGVASTTAPALVAQASPDQKTQSAKVTKAKKATKTTQGTVLLAQATPTQATPATPLLAQATTDQGAQGAQGTGAPQTPAPGATSPNAPVSEVVVTGSRIERSTFTTPNPVTVLNSQDIQNLGITNVGAVLNQLPQNSSFFAANNVGLGNFNVGAQLANLRGLNPFFGTRTLTLVDTERFVEQATGGGVDVTLIPSMLVARTEVVTGGGSAVYGSDAVAGVVNIILDKKLQGFKGQIDYGQTSHHDGGDPHISLAYGTDLGDRLHFIIGGEFENSEDIGICSQVRSWCSSNYGLFTNTLFNGGAPPFPGAPPIPANGLPHYIIGPNATLANQSQTGVLTPCVAFVGVCIHAGPQWLINAAGNGATVFNPGQFADGAGVFGFSQGAGATGIGAYDGTTIKPSVKRYTGLADLEWKITENLNSFFQFDYARSESVNPVANGAIGPIMIEVNPGVFVPLSSQINAGNPFLPAQFQPGGADALGPAGALLGYNMNGIYPARNVTHNHVERFTTGLNGEISSTWNWDAYFEYGQNYNSQQLFNNVVGSFLQNALDVVTNPATGQPECAVGPPCVPLNLFGANNASPAALAYAFRTLYEFSELKQYVLSGNVHGDLFSGFGAGPIKIALGLEARRDTADVTHNLDQQPWYDSYFLSYGLDYAGKIDVVEGYTELDIPVLKDLPAAKSLEFDGAIRETSNTNTNQTAGAATDGESVTHVIPSWKLSGTWDLTDWVRIRGTRSRDIRAPFFRELYESYAVTASGPFSTITNPATNTSQSVNALTGGNINLIPETSDTETAGIVFAPKSGPLNRLQFSADWYRIVINNPITGPPFGLGVQNIVNLCSPPNGGPSNPAFCDRITFANPGATPAESFAMNTTPGSITVNNTAVNLGQYEVRGVDFETDYRLPLQDVNDSFRGDINVRWITSLLYNMTIDAGLGTTPVNYAGQSGPTAAFGGFNTSPRWQSNFFVTYNTGPWTGTVQVRWVGPGTYNAITASGGSPVTPGQPGYPTDVNSQNTNSVPAAYYLNLAGSYDVTSHVSVFASINNVLNKDPPIAPGGNGYPTNPVYFDTYGMFWRVGVRAQF